MDKYVLETSILISNLYPSYYIDLLKHVLDLYCKRKVFNKAEIN